MTQIQQLGFFANNLTVNAASNSASFGGSINATAHTIGTTFIANTTQLTITTPFSANGGVGTAGQVLTSNGATGSPYWSTVSTGGGGGGFSNGQSISVANLAITGSLTAASSVGTSGQILTSTGTGVQWSTLGTTYSYSSLFNGSTQNLSVAANSAFNLGTNNFTIETWIYPTALPTLNNIANILAQYDNTAGVSTTAFLFALYNNAGTMQLLMQPTSGSTQTVISGTYAFAVNTWYHIAVVRNSNNIYLYVNGVQVGTTTAYSSSINTSSTALTIASRLSSGAAELRFSGYISNLRFVNGVAVYTGAFTPPNTLLSATQGTGTNIAAISGTQTSLLTCQTQSINDASTYNFQITNTGGVTTTTNIPFPATNVTIPTTSLTSVRQQFTGDGSTTSFAVAGGYTANAISVFLNGVLLRNGTEVTVTNGSTVVFASAPPNGSLIDVIGTVPTTYSSITPVGYSTSFNGTSQYLTIPNNAALTLGTGDFTVECWAYMNSAGNVGIYAKRASSAIYGLTFGIDSTYHFTSGIPNAAGNGWTQLLVSSITFSTNIWYHFACVRYNGTVTLYVNGIPVASGAASNSIYDDGTAAVIGCTGSVTPSAYFPGYISNFRIVKGVAVYTGPFTPSGPLSAVQSATSTAAAITGTQTSLLTCNGPTIIDSSTNAFTITNNGSAPVSTSIVPTFTNVTITTSSSGSGGLSLSSVQTANITASAGYIYPINTSNGPVYVTLPASPTAGQQFALTDYAGTFGSNNCILNPNGNKISGSTSNAILASSREGVSLVYVDSTQGWLGYGNFVTNPIGPYSVSYLIVAGGGGGGGNQGGGGGAGGLLQGNVNLTPGTVYSFTVGAGGAGGASGVVGTSGANSSAFGFTVIGGGGGGAKTLNALSGGSGGGGGPAATPSSPGSGTSGQGYAGGAGADGVSVISASGGGGGAGSVGGNSGTTLGSAAGGAGGSGVASSITGISLFYAGGGGGGTDHGAGGGSGAGGTGGSGVGGNGGAYTDTAATSATANRGGGGGGAGWTTAGYNAGGAGGSGVIILSIPTYNYTGIKTGTPSVTINGNYTILTFTASGTYTA